ncbi:sodium channel regulatory subunit beta-2-like isoform X2 [Rhinoraja longicauda]
MKVTAKPVLQLLRFALFGLMLLSCGWAMEVMVTPHLVKLNGTSAKLTCTFNSCYNIKNKDFSLNWTYQECENCTEDRFVQYHHRLIFSRTERFWGRVQWSGNLEKKDVSITIHDIQTDDEGFYKCHVLNPPDRHKGLGIIHLSVVTEVAPERDSIVGVIIGASVGGLLGVLILVLVVVKCVRRKKKQDNQSEDQKTEEEGKTDGEGNQEEEEK